MEIIDLSYEIHSEMPVYPDDINAQLIKEYSVERDGWCSYTLRSGMHAGTHADAPMHMLQDVKEFIGDAPLDRFAGPLRLIDCRGKREIGPEVFTGVSEGDAVIIWTGSDEKYGCQEYYTEHPVLTQDAARFLAGRKVKLVGIDTPSPDYEPYMSHKLLLGAGIYIIENLTGLYKLEGREHLIFFAPPLKIRAEGSLTRAFCVDFNMTIPDSIID